MSFGVPHSNADTDRIFSNVNLIKTDIKSLLNTKTGAALLSSKEGIKVNAEICYKFSPSEDLVTRMQSAVLYDIDLEAEVQI